MQTIIHNGKIVLADRIIESGWLRITDGVISETGAGEPAIPAGAETLDAHGGWVSPGLVDIHTHGFGGFWGFWKSDDILKMAAAIVKFGVTAILPATVSLPHDQVLNSISAIRTAMSRQVFGADFSTPPPEEQLSTEEQPQGARILGVHLEGPYINKEKPGAHPPMCIRNPQENEISDILERGGDALRIVTLAPEIPGGMELTELLSKKGIVVSIGHSNATAEQTREAIERGARHFTHIFNAVRQFHQREPGCAFTALASPEISVEIILDNKHVHADAARLVLASKQKNKLVLVSDSIIAAGCAEGTYNVWGFDVIVKDGKAQLKDGTMAGSILTLNKAVKNAVELLDAEPLQAFRMATANPCEVIGIENKAGTLAPGRTADITVLSPDFDCAATFIAGRKVFER